jgi:hypothetical protein
MEENNVIDYGKWNVPTSWNQITLKMYQKIEAFYDNTENKSFDVREVIHILCNKTIDEVNALPVEFLDNIMEKMSFLQTKVTEEEPTNTLTINGEKYVVNIQNKLKVGEYVAVDSIIKDDKHNYAAMLAILCRKEGELYDSKFENEILEDRVHLWEQQPITDVLRVISFFLQCYMISATPILLSSKIKEAIDYTRKGIETSHKNGEISRRSMKFAMKKLRKLEKSIKNI